MPEVTRTLIIVNVAMFAITLLLGGQTLAWFALMPPGYGFAPWQMITYAFMHGSITHIAFNMFGLYFMGADVERVWGARRFLIYYFVCVVSAALLHIAIMELTDAAPAPMVGASGGVFGMLLAFAMLFPRRTIVPLIPPIPMPAWVFAMLYGALELVLGVTGTQEGVAHFAHLGGMLGGFLLIQHWRGPRRRF